MLALSSYNKTVITETARCLNNHRDTIQTSRAEKTMTKLFCVSTTLSGSCTINVAQFKFFWKPMTVICQTGLLIYYSPFYAHAPSLHQWYLSQWCNDHERSCWLHPPFQRSVAQGGKALYTFQPLLHLKKERFFLNRSIWSTATWFNLTVQTRAKRFHIKCNGVDIKMCHVACNKTLSAKTKYN